MRWNLVAASPGQLETTFSRISLPKKPLKFIPDLPIQPLYAELVFLPAAIQFASHPPRRFVGRRLRKALLSRRCSLCRGIIPGIPREFRALQGFCPPLYGHATRRWRVAGGLLPPGWRFGRAEPPPALHVEITAPHCCPSYHPPLAITLQSICPVERQSAPHAATANPRYN